MGDRNRLWQTGTRSTGASANPQRTHIHTHIHTHTYKSIMTTPTTASNWRGMDGEDEMTDRDWHQRGHEQASCLVATGDIEFANPDLDGVPTGGCYNGDYTEEQHAAANAALSDEYTEAEVESEMSDLYRVHLDS